jgi:hypothetical protein
VYGVTLWIVTHCTTLVTPKLRVTPVARVARRDGEWQGQRGVMKTEHPQRQVCWELQSRRIWYGEETISLLERRKDLGVVNTRERSFEDAGKVGDVKREPAEFHHMEPMTTECRVLPEKAQGVRPSLSCQPSKAKRSAIIT